MLSDVRGCDRNRADGHSWKRYGQCFSPVELPDEDAIRELKIPVILKFIKMRCCRQGSLVDMSDVLNELYESYGETSKVNLYSIDLKFTDFDQVDAIEVPEEVKEAAGE